MHHLLFSKHIESVTQRVHTYIIHSAQSRSNVNQRRCPFCARAVFASKIFNTKKGEHRKCSRQKYLTLTIKSACAQKSQTPRKNV